MAEQIHREKTYGNFRPSLVERHKAKPTALDRRKRREGNSEAHREYIRKLPCCVTLRMPSGEGHHLKSGPAKNERGINLKATDKWLVPLSRPAHIGGVEKLGSRRELEWFRKNGIADPYALAAALYSASGDVAKGTKIIIAARGGK